MSETTSPSVTNLPKAPSRSVSRRLDAHLAEAPDLLVGVAGFSQRRDDIPLQVRHVAGDQARLTLGAQPHLSYSRRQYAGLGPLEPLRPSPVLDPHRVSHVREGKAAFEMSRLRVRPGEGPALEGEVRAGAAHYAAVRAVFQYEAGVGAGQIVRL